MTNARPTATPLSHTIELQLTGQPPAKNRWGSGSINPTRVLITYLDDRRHAHLYGRWINHNGVQTDAPLDQVYRHDDDWPDWLTAMALEHAPAGQTAETDEERADREETERDHAQGDHTHCGITCETEMPTEHLQNFVIAKGYPGTKGALDELLRRARAAAVLPPPADRADVLHEAADAVAQMRVGAEDPNPDDHVRGYNNALDHVETELRRMGDETAERQDGPQR